jgi:LysR family transcriptional regulator, regulator for genes of the gallate degradation pathway
VPVGRCGRAAAQPGCHRIELAGAQGYSIRAARHKFLYETMQTIAIPNLRHLRIFATVARLESMSQASAEVHLSQPAVTQAVAKLEQEIGARLFERRNTGCFLTEDGRILWRRTLRLFEQIEAALVWLGPAPRNIEGKISRPQVRSLIALAEHGTFAAAARALAVSEESLNRAVHDLERTLRRPIVQRTAQGVATTPPGAELARRLQLAMREIALATEELDAARGSGRGRIAIGTLPLAGSFFIARAVKDLTAIYPEAHISLAEGAYDLLLRQLRSGALDLIIGPIRLPDPALGVVEEPLFLDPYSVVVRRGHPLTRARKITVADLAACDWVIPPPGAPRRLAFDALFAQSRRKPRASVQTSSLGIIRALLAETDRVSLLNRYEVLSEERIGVLTALPFRLADTGRAIQVTTRVDWLPTAVQLRFVELLREHAQTSE